MIYFFLNVFSEDLYQYLIDVIANLWGDMTHIVLFMANCKTLCPSSINKIAERKRIKKHSADFY